MTPRLNAFAAAPASMKAWLEYGQSVSKLGLEAESHGAREDPRFADQRLRLLPRHARRRRAQGGETEQRLYLLDAWRDSPLYSERERAALAWTEALTRLADSGAPDDVYQALKAHFSEEEQVALTLLIVTINGWNRIQVGFRAVHPVRRQEGGVTPSETEDAAASFDPLRPRLIRVAYRMLGSVADAEDAVQDAFLRWLARRSRRLSSTPEAYLRRVVIRICLDELKSARRRRETYIGPWLPEPVVDAGRGRGGRRHPAADDGARAPVAARTRRLPPARRVRRDLRRGRRNDRARRRGLPPAREPGAGACPGRAPTLSRRRGARARNRRRLLRRQPQRRHAGAALAACGGRRPVCRWRRQKSRGETAARRARRRRAVPRRARSSASPIADRASYATAW